MKSLKGFMDEICFIQREPYKRNSWWRKIYKKWKWIYTKRSDLEKLKREQMSSEESSEHGVVIYWFLLLPFYSLIETNLSIDTGTFSVIILLNIIETKERWKNEGSLVIEKN